MKCRFLIIAASVCMVFATASCTKNYTCHCDITYTGSPGLPDSTYTEYTIKNTKASAKSKCQNESGSYTNNGITMKENCYLY